MSSFMGSCIGTFISYTGAKICSSECKISFQNSRYIYLLFFGLCALFTFFFQTFIDNRVDLCDYLPWYSEYGLQVDITCSQNSVYRLSFAVFTFYSIMAFFSSLKHSCFSSWWGAKIFMLICILVSYLIWMPQSVIDVFIPCAAFGSGLFMVTQVIILIDFAYTLNETLVEYDEEKHDSNMWKNIILIISTCFILCSMTFYIWMFVHYEGVKLVFSVLSLLYQFVQTGVSISEVAPHGTLLTSSIVGLYTTYLCFNGFTESHLNTFASSCFTILSITFAAHSTSKTNIFHTLRTMKEQQRLSGTIEQKNSMDEIMVDVDVQQNDTYSRDSPYFHIMFALGGMYMSMFYTNWALTYTLSNTSIKIISQWVCGILYLWTLIAPVMLVDRDFS